MDADIEGNDVIDKDESIGGIGEGIKIIEGIGDIEIFVSDNGEIDGFDVI